MEGVAILAGLWIRVQIGKRGTRRQEDAMKKNTLQQFLIYAIIVLLLFQLEDCGKKSSSGGTSVASIPDSLKRYPFRSAIIEVHYSGAAIGKQMTYIDDFGQKETTVDSLTMKMMDLEMPSYKISVRKNDTLYQVDYVRGMATKGASPVTANDQKAMSSMGEEMAKGMGMKKSDSEEIVAGQKCAVWTSDEMGTKSWLWNNITLKSEARIGDDTIRTEAVAVNFNVPVPAEHFLPPQGIHYTTVEEMESKLSDFEMKSDKDRMTRRHAH